MNQEAKVLEAQLRQWKALQRQAPSIVGRTARRMFLDAFKKQGSYTDTGTVTPWQQRGASPANRQGRALLRKTGQLARSIQYAAYGHRIIISSPLPYAQLQNDGGTVKITPKMRRFFWAKFYEAGGDNNGKPSHDAQFWRSMALHRGSTLTVTARPFIYDSRHLVTLLNREFKHRLNKIFTA